MSARVIPEHIIERAAEAICNVWKRHAPPLMRDMYDGKVYVDQASELARVAFRAALESGDILLATDRLNVGDLVEHERYPGAVFRVNRFDASTELVSEKTNAVPYWLGASIDEFKRRTEP